jgi:hypothetical protein
MKFSLLKIFRPEFLVSFFFSWIIVCIVGIILTGPRPLRVATPAPNFFFSACLTAFAVIFIAPLVSTRARRMVLTPEVAMREARRTLVLLGLIFGVFALGTFVQGMRLWSA